MDSQPKIGTSTSRHVFLIWSIVYINVKIENSTNLWSARSREEK